MPGDDFVAIIRATVVADPSNVGLRIDLVELLLEADVDATEAELVALASLGANPQTLLVLQARAAAARLRRGGGSTTSAPDAASAPQRPVAAPVAPTPATSVDDSATRIAWLHG